LSVRGHSNAFATIGASAMSDPALLFLDIDGVLHSSSGRQHLLSRLPLLESLLRGRPSVDVVISSTWRLRRSLAELSSVFSEDLQARVVGATPAIWASLWEPPPMYVRWSEIGAWLRANAPPGGTWTRWAALDDQHWLFPPFTTQLVAIADPPLGVTQAELDLLDEVLQLAL
jgi:hypothetical protein